MKTSCLLLALVTVAAADEAPRPRITAAELVKLQQASPLRDLQKPAAGADKAAPTEEPSIIKQSMILREGNYWTLVPKGAAVYMPESLRGHVNGKPVGTLLAWSDFFARNRGWITTNEVSFNQAAGSDPIPAARVAFWSKQDKMVIAVHQGGPISVRLEKPVDPSIVP